MTDFESFDNKKDDQNINPIEINEFNSKVKNNSINNDIENDKDSKFVTFNNETVNYEDESYGKLITNIKDQNENLENSNQ